ncbi:hypothetical protein G9A89_020280 [Geosiphon pyriformis]|nr:hypothetical protein G9A89_020280 [Geosiphon pyriformis]
MVNAKAESATTRELLEIKDNFLSLPKSEYVMTFDVFGNIKNNPKYFHKHYQNLTPTKKEQEQRLADLNTKLLKEELITKNMSFQDSTEDIETEQYLAYSDLFKEFELKWYSDNKEEICSKKVHDTDAGFDL